MPTPFADMEKCPRCWAHFTKGYDHQCPPFMVALVALHEAKKNTIEPDKSSFSSPASADLPERED